MINGKQHSHKKQKNGLEGSLDRALFAAKLEFPKILIPRLIQHTSDVHIECAEKSRWVQKSLESQKNYIVYIWPAFLGADTS